MSQFSDFADEIMRTLQSEHDLVMALNNEVKLLSKRIEKLEQKQ